MKIPRIRAVKLASAMLAGGIALSTVLGPALLPADLGGSAARADVVVNIDLFQRELSPYGRWDNDPRYGQVWYPRVAQGWRPYYNDGHWVYSDDYGWLWVSDASWGWAPFHYGRWVLTDYGWAWVPGTVWGPAWVSFRSAPDYIGWAPLPPEDDWDDGYGFRNRPDVTDARFWVFVRPQGFVERRFDRYAYDRRDYPRFIKRTTNITNITIINNRVVNRGIQVDHVERVTHRRVDRVRVADADRPERTQLQGNKVVVYRPRVTDDAKHQERVNSGSVKNDQGVTTRKKNTQQQFVAPNGQQPTVGDNATQQQLKKKRNQGNANVNGRSNQQQFVAPGQAQPSVGDNATEQQLPKKKRNQGNANINGGSKQQQLVAPNQMQPSAGGNAAEQQLPVKKKKQRTNANINGGQQQQFLQNNGGPDMPQTKKRSKPQVQNQPKVQQQPQIRKQRQQQQGQPQQQHYQVNKKQSQQCKNGDQGACGN